MDQRNDSVPIASSRMPPTMPPAAMAPFHKVTSMAWAASAWSPPASPAAVCSRVGTPPQPNPHRRAATYTKAALSADCTWLGNWVWRRRCRPDCPGWADTYCPPATRCGAATCTQQARRIAAQHGYTYSEIHSELGLVLGARRSGDLDADEAHLTRIRDGYADVSSKAGDHLLLAEHGFIAELRGDAERAFRHRLRGLEVAREID